MGAIDGQVIDADGSTVLFRTTSTSTAYRVPTSLTIPLSTATTDTAVIKQFVMTLRRQMIRALNGMPLGNAKIIIVCGDNFFDALVTSKEYISWVKVGLVRSRRAPRISCR